MLGQFVGIEASTLCAQSIRDCTVSMRMRSQLYSARLSKAFLALFKVRSTRDFNGPDQRLSCSSDSSDDLDPWGRA
ncbi:hypothetical protein D3C85_1572750 [compost metagenome]